MRPSRTILLNRIQEEASPEKVPKALARRFGFVMGYLYTGRRNLARVCSLPAPFDP